MVPTDALQLTVTGTLSPVVVRPKAANCWVWPGSSATLSGATTTTAAGRLVEGPAARGAIASHAVESAAQAPAAKSHLTRECMSPSWRGVRFGGSTDLARGQRAVASELCVPGFRRVCLCRLPRGGSDPAERSEEHT